MKKVCFLQMTLASCLALLLLAALPAFGQSDNTAARLPYCKPMPQVIGGEHPLTSFSRPIKVSANGETSPLSVAGTRLVAHVASWDNHLPGVYMLTPPTDADVLKGDMLYYDASRTMPLIAAAGLVEDKLYLLGFDLYQQFGGFLAPYYYIIDTATGKMTESGSMGQHHELVALESAQAADGTVYGQFFADNKGKTYTYGTVDVVKRERLSTVGMTTLRSVALGVTNEGKLYSIAEDGNLYQVNLTTGKEELIGATGLTPSDGKNFWSQTGEIDPETNTFWWFAIDRDCHCGIYTVDLNTGKATLVEDFGTSTPPFEVVGMVIPPAVAADGSPAAATNVRYSFDQASTQGMAYFTMPTKTFSGDDLTGSIRINISDETGVISTGQASPGRNFQLNVGTTEGLHTLVLTLSNAAGTSPKSKATLWVGYDNPKTVDNLTLNIDNETLQANLTWTAPVDTRHGGYLGPLTYDVYRKAADTETLVASNLTECAFTETLDKKAGQTKYAYKVVAVNTTQRSADAWSNDVVVGDPIALPYIETFQDYAVLDNFVIIDANNDGTTWGPAQWYQNTIEYNTYDNGKADDWLITPPITLKTDRFYKFHIKVHGVGAAAYTDCIEVTMGSAPVPESLTTTVVEPTDVWQYDPLTTLGSDAVSVAEEGIYYFGIHAISNVVNNYSSLCVCEISIEEGAALIGPAQVESLTVSADEDCALKAAVSFTAPVTYVNGDQLTTPVTVEIQRNADLLATLTDVSPGQQVSYVDEGEGLGRGWNDYTVTPVTTDGIRGRDITARAYIGEDSPVGVGNINIDDRQTSVHVTWDATPAIGQNGGHVRQDQVTYNLWSSDWYEQYNSWHALSILVSTPDLSADTEVSDTDLGTQELAAYGVGVENTASIETGTRVPIYVATYVTGKPYAMPFHENVSGESADNFWSINLGATTVAAGLARDSSDGDGSCLALQATQGGPGVYAELVSGKIALTDDNPTLTFAMRRTSADATAYLAVVTPDGSRHSLADDLSLTSTWAPYTFDLTPWTSARYIRLVFGAQFSDAALLLFDDVSVTNATAIHEIADSERHAGSQPVYSVDGKLVTDHADSHTLPAGVYITGGKKLVVK